MRFMLMMCPHCEHIGDPCDFESVEAPEDTDLPRASESCEKYEILARRLIEEDEEANCLDIAYYFHQGACCRKVEHEDPVPLLKDANRYFRKAKEQGVESFAGADIDTLIERTDV